MKKISLQIVGVLALTSVLSGCFIQLIGAPGGFSVGTTIPACNYGETCTNAEIRDTTFNETFFAFPAPGFSFLHWKSGTGYLYGCNTSVVNVNTSGWGGTFLAAWFTLPDQYYMAPVFRSTGPEILYTTDFECNNANATVLGDGWKAYVNVFQSNGTTYVGGYSVQAGAPNGAQISALATGQGGAAQSSRQLNVFSNYESTFNGINQHATGQQVEVLVFQERTLLAGSAGTYTFTFDAKLPPSGAVTAPSQAIAFVKVLDPAAGYQPIPGTVNTFNSTTLTSAWSTQSVSVTVTAAMVGKLLQFGFQNTSTSYNGSGVIYDNVVFRKTAP